VEIPLVLLAARRRSLHLAALAAFFVSGFAALVYQVVWQRILVLFSEGCISAFGLGNRRLYYDFLYQSLGAHQLSTPLLTLMLFGSLLWPTFSVEPAIYTPGFDRTRLTDVNTDLFPRDEYDLSPLR
jgi:hypothetical protein